jgi:glc operon protein GlcG
MKFQKLASAAAAFALAAGIAHAQIPQYGPNVTLEQAKKALAAGEAESKKNNWPMAIAVVDTAGQLVAFVKMDGTQTASVMVAQDKAVSSAIFRRPSKAFQDVVAKGGDGLRILTLRGASAIEGGVPLYGADGKIIGAVGVSGAASDQDGVVAKAAADSLK